MPRDPIPDDQRYRHHHQDSQFQAETSLAEEFSDVAFLKGKVAEGGSFGLVEEEDEEGVEGVEGREEKVGGEVERDEEL